MPCQSGFAVWLQDAHPARDTLGPERAPAPYTNLPLTEAGRDPRQEGLAAGVVTGRPHTNTPTPPPLLCRHTSSRYAQRPASQDTAPAVLHRGLLLCSGLQSIPLPQPHGPGNSPSSQRAKRSQNAAGSTSPSYTPPKISCRPPKIGRAEVPVFLLLVEGDKGGGGCRFAGLSSRFAGCLLLSSATC